jgi:hypothetical protein
MRQLLVGCISDLYSAIYVHVKLFLEHYVSTNIEFNSFAPTLGRFHFCPLFTLLHMNM